MKNRETYQKREEKGANNDYQMTSGGFQPLYLEIKIKQAVMVVSKDQAYQRKLIVLLTLACVEIAFSNLMNSTIFTNPLIKCGETIVSEAVGCPKLTSGECSFENSYTATHYAGLYCQNKDLRMKIQAIYAPGLIMGFFFFSIVADSRGRRLALIGSFSTLTVGYLLLFIGIYFQLFLLIGLGQFISGASSSVGRNIGYTIASELFSDGNRQRGILLFCAGGSMAEIMVMGIYNIAPFWWVYLVIFGLIPTLTLVIIFQAFLVETPQFHINVEGNWEAAKESIEKIGEFNKADQKSLQKAGRKIDQLCNSNFIGENCQKTSPWEVLRQIMRNSYFVKTIICLAFIKFGFYFFYYGVLSSLERTGVNFGFNMLILGTGELLGYFLGKTFVHRVQRKKLLVSSNLLKGIIGMCFITTFISSSAVLSSLALISTCLLGAFNYSAITMLETESFSSEIQSTAIGIIFSLSYISRMFLPFMIGAMNEAGIHPLIACSAVLMLAGIIPSFFLHETWGIKADRQMTRSTYDVNPFSIEMGAEQYQEMADVEMGNRRQRGSALLQSGS